MNRKNIKEIRLFTVQLFRKKSNIEPIDFEPWASAFLLESNHHHYLCTASHVYENADFKDIGFCINTNFYIITGEMSLLNVTESIENNRADIAIWKLTNVCVEDLKQKYSFFNIYNIELNHEISDLNNYFIYGYPLTKTKINKKKLIIKSIPLELSTQAYTIPEKYKKLQINRKINIILRYHKSKLYDPLGVKTNGPHPTGISGSGLWYYAGSDLKLIGIMTEWISEEAVLIATKIDILIGLIKYGFDQTLVTNNYVTEGK